MVDGWTDSRMDMDEYGDVWLDGCVSCAKSSHYEQPITIPFSIVLKGEF